MATVTFNNTGEMLIALDMLDLGDFRRKNAMKIFAWFEQCMEYFNENRPASKVVVRQIIACFEKYETNAIHGECYKGERLSRKNISHYARWVVSLMLGYLDEKGYIPQVFVSKITYYNWIFRRGWEQVRAKKHTAKK